MKGVADVRGSPIAGCDASMNRRKQTRTDALVTRPVTECKIRQRIVFETLRSRLGINRAHLLERVLASL